MSDAARLERRIQALEDIEAIRRLKYKYFRCLDLKLWDEMRTCFASDATVAYGDGTYRFEGVDAILEFLSTALGTERGSLGSHHGHHPEIDLTGATTAKGTWALDNYLFNPKQKRNVRIAAFYRDDYVKIDGAWKFQHIGYSYVYHEEWSREDTPSLKLLVPRQE